MEQLKKTMENWWKPWKIEENHANHGQTNDPIETIEQKHETNRKIDEQCEWEILATKCSKWVFFGCKNQGREPGRPKIKIKIKKRKKCALNLMCSVRFAVWMQRAQQLAAQGRTGVVKPAAQGKTRSLPPPFLRPGTKGGAQCLVPSQVQVPGEAPKEEAARRRGRSS